MIIFSLRLNEIEIGETLNLIIIVMYIHNVLVTILHSQVVILYCNNHLERLRLIAALVNEECAHALIYFVHLILYSV